MTANNRLTPWDYPYSILYNNDWEEPYRAMRIREMIENKEKLTLDGLKTILRFFLIIFDMKSIQFDETTLLFRDLKPLLERISNGGKWRDTLLAWDGNENVKSREATLFEAWYIELSKLPAEEVGQDYWDVPLYLIPALLNGTDANCQKHEGGCLGKKYRQTSGKSCLGFAEQAWQKALKRYGNNVPTWGSVHDMSFQHPILSMYFSLCSMLMYRKYRDWLHVWQNYAERRRCVYCQSCLLRSCHFRIDWRCFVSANY